MADEPKADVSLPTEVRSGDPVSAENFNRVVRAVRPRSEGGRRHQETWPHWNHAFECSEASNTTIRVNQGYVIWTKPKWGTSLAYADCDAWEYVFRFDETTYDMTSSSDWASDWAESGGTGGVVLGLEIDTEHAAPADPSLTDHAYSGGAWPSDEYYAGGYGVFIPLARIRRNPEAYSVSGNYVYVAQQYHTSNVIVPLNYALYTYVDEMIEAAIDALP
jgi:hypothetical protein